ncbi:hypothetical protein QNZ47_004566 [Enterobacter cloacae]|nr:hypothetical protein [Enterobacter cloacae]
MHKNAPPSASQASPAAHCTRRRRGRALSEGQIIFCTLIALMVSMLLRALVRATGGG